MAALLIERYVLGCSLLTAATSDLSIEHERARPGPGKWSIAELVAHVTDTDLVDSDRMKRVIAEDDPVLSAFNENAWLARLNSSEMPIEDAVNLFAANRKWTARILPHPKRSRFRGPACTPRPAGKRLQRSWRKPLVTLTITCVSFMQSEPASAPPWSRAIRYRSRPPAASLADASCWRESVRGSSCNAFGRTNIRGRATDAGSSKRRGRVPPCRAGTGCANAKIGDL